MIRNTVTSKINIELELVAYTLLNGLVSTPGYIIIDLWLGLTTCFS